MYFVAFFVGDKKSYYYEAFLINVGLIEISYFNVLLNLKLYLLSIHKGL